ncbi:MAG: MopE-related protein, partial [Myxococcota bacterium]
YDGVDQDCDGNDGDQDGDGFALTYDCDDENADANPDAAEVDGNGVDDDCDGVVDLPAEDDTGVPPPADEGCACDAGTAAGTLPGLLLALAAVRRRRR